MPAGPMHVRPPAGALLPGGVHLVRHRARAVTERSRRNASAAQARWGCRTPRNAKPPPTRVRDDVATSRVGCADGPTDERACDAGATTLSIHIKAAPPRPKKAAGVEKPTCATAPPRATARDHGAATYRIQKK